MDSWGKIPSGILKGNLYEFGEFSQCLNIKRNEKPYKTQYCLGQIIFDVGDMMQKSKSIQLDINHMHIPDVWRMEGRKIEQRMLFLPWIYREILFISCFIHWMKWIYFQATEQTSVDYWNVFARVLFTSLAWTHYQWSNFRGAKWSVCEVSWRHMSIRWNTFWFEDHWRGCNVSLTIIIFIILFQWIDPFFFTSMYPRCILALFLCLIIVSTSYDVISTIINRKFQGRTFSYMHDIRCFIIKDTNWLLLLITSRSKISNTFDIFILFEWFEIVFV